MNFEQLLEGEYAQMEIDALSESQRQSINTVMESGWQLETIEEGVAKMDREGSKLNIDAEGKMFVEGVEVSASDASAEE